MKFNKSLTVGILIGAMGMGTYAVGGCSDHPELVIKPVSANTGGAGGSGGNASVGGSGGSGGASGNNYPVYFEGLPPSSPEVLELVDCWVSRNEELKGDSQDFRLGMRIFSTGWCGACGIQREKLGKEAMYELFDAGIYVDCDLDDNSAMACYAGGAYWIPSNNIFYKETRSAEGVGERNFLINYKLEGTTAPEEFPLLVPECPYNAPTAANLESRLDKPAVGENRCKLR